MCWNVYINVKCVCVCFDGSVCIVIVYRDPQLADATWLDAAGHTNGVWTLRWLEAETKPLPKAKLLPFDRLAQEFS